MCSRVDYVSLEFYEDMCSRVDYVSPEFCEDVTYTETKFLTPFAHNFISAYPSYSHCYTLFPLLVLLDATVDCRTSNTLGSEEKVVSANVLKMPQKVSDSVAEGVLQCLEELIKKCLLGSVDQMVVVLKKLIYGALLSPSDASEEFCEGVIKCFRAILLNLLTCSDESCACNKSLACLLFV
ncbi:hypothetical protein L3X38_037119 [Prunus dulcis]|uniref:ARM repeat superfamily protein n=1 Tax=Prunus dulcis TaxID=3755 RepID=A0AAD4V4H1_PRUDU|nr:hypothetical protein L3X38_037119 [Prunus dulcis]